MNSYLNYLLEANLGLLLLLAIYKLFLERETNFQFKRLFLLAGILSSLLFPLVHVNLENQLVPSVSEVIPTYWLPEVTVGDNAVSEPIPVSVWAIAGYFYLGGLFLFSLRFFIQLGKLSQIIKKSETVYSEGFRVAISNKTQSTFSFFNFIFIGQIGELSDAEKQQIIQHESVHARQLHSIDIVLLNILGILFWFNPCIRIYKNIFVQLHEFEADSRVAENRDVNEYCSLLAKVALLSADITIANHFNNSLTLKRIAMMKAMKQKIKKWKFIMMVATIPLLFFVISCNDQLIQDRIMSDDNLPVEAKNRFTQFQKAYAGETFIVEYNNEANRILTELDNKYGQAKHIELFTLKEKGKTRNFSMLQYASDKSPSPVNDGPGDEIFTVVEQSPAFEGGSEEMGKFISQNLKYPEKARQEGKEGTVFIQFVVEKDGSISDANVIRGVEESLDAEALRVVKLTKWNPGQQNGHLVRVRFVLPIKYKL